MAEQLASLAGRLTDRDRAILRLVFEHRVFTSHQLGEAFFGSHDRAEHRLRELTDAEALARFRPYRRHGEGSAPYHYVLGPAGAAVLAAEQGIELRRLGYRQDKALEVAHSQRLAHTVGVNGFFTALHAHARQHPHRAQLAAWWPERRCRERWEPIVRLDGYGRWHEDGRQVDFFLEYDRGTEPWTGWPATKGSPRSPGSPPRCCCGCPPRAGRPASGRPWPTSPCGPRCRSWSRPPVQRSATARPSRHGCP